MPEVVGIKRLQRKATTQSSDVGWLEETTAERRALPCAGKQSKAQPEYENAPGSAGWARTGQLLDVPVTWMSKDVAFDEVEA